MENFTLTDQEIKQFEASKEQYSKMNLMDKVKLIFFVSVSLFLLIFGFVLNNDKGEQSIFGGLTFTLITLIYYLVVNGRCKKISKTEIKNLTIIEGTLNHRPVRPKNDSRNFTIKATSSKKHFIGNYKKYGDFSGIKVRVFHHENYIFVVSYITS